MKLATPEELEGHHQATVRGAIEGVAAGFAIAMPGLYIANKKWPAFRAMPVQLKTLAAIIIT